MSMIMMVMIDDDVVTPPVPVHLQRIQFDKL